MKTFKAAVVVLVLFLAVGSLIASGPVGIYGIVEKVVFEPNESAPERIQIWGAFALVDGGLGAQGAMPAYRGYLYFRLPTQEESMNARTSRQPPQSAIFVALKLEGMKNEWMDLKSVAGTGQAIGFGNWFYEGAFSYDFIHPELVGSSKADLRVRPESEKPAFPTIYSTNVGVIKLNQGNHSAIINDLQALKRSPTR